MGSASVKWARRGTFAIGCLTLLGCFLNPVVALIQSAILFAIARGMKKNRAWPAIAGTVLWLLPSVLMPVRQPTMTPELLAALALSTALGLLTGTAAFTLWRNADARRGGAPWLAFLVLFTIGYLTFRPFVMPTDSMQPALLNGDHIFFETASWTLGRAPQRGDLVAFRYPVDRRQTFVKRIVGVAGDRLCFRAKQLVRNGSPVAEPWAVHTVEFTDEYRDNFPSGEASYLTARGTGMLQKYVRDGHVVVPPDSYFVLGDNRDASLDSRYWGFVDRRDIIGSPVLIYGSYQTAAASPSPTILQMRWNRLFKRP